MASGVVADAFEVAKKEFILKFQKTSQYDFSKLSSIDDVYKETERIQNEQGAKRFLRNLGKIRPFLDSLCKYEKVIETFVQVKPDVLALIWGPIRFILVIACSYAKTWDKMLDTMAQIGAVLPNFQLYASIFEQHGQISHVLRLFFQDILDFHETAVNFFSLKGWKEIFEILWPKYEGKFNVVVDNIKNHTMLMQGEVTVAHIVEADEARKLALEEYERAHEGQDRQAFDSVISSLNPALYDKEQERLSIACSPGTGNWLAGHSTYTKWLDAADDSSKLLWIQGIPGAGKSHLISAVNRELLSGEHPFAFAFLTYSHRHEISTLKLLHSFMCQLVLENKSLRSILTSAHDEHYRQLKGSISFAKETLYKLIKHQAAAYFVVDGLDEISPSERTLLVDTLLQLQAEVNSLKVLFASRAEHDLSRLLEVKASFIRVHDNNATDVAKFVEEKADELVSQIGPSSGVASEVHQLMRIISAKAEGMFLYARLLCDILADSSSLDAMRAEINNLPDGLDAAYQRIIERIESELGTRARQEAKTILELVSSSAVLLSKNEIQLAIHVALGGEASQGCRDMFLNLIQRCGPVIEEVDGKIQFVHHTAQEYLFSARSPYLSRTEAHSKVASICTRYLTSSCFDTEASDGVILDNLLSGAYVLEQFACTSWLYHVEEAGSYEELALLPYVSELLAQRANSTYDKVYDLNDDQLRSFMTTAPVIHWQLIEIKAFLRRRWQDLCFNDGKNWQHNDPLSLSISQIRIWGLLEDKLCVSQIHTVGCRCDDLKALYGTRIFKCSRPGCSFQRTGFDTRDQRDRHIQTHQRPFKCQHHGCPFSDLGFTTQSLLSSHSARFHCEQPTSSTTSVTGTVGSSDEITILVDAIRLHDLHLANDIAFRLHPRQAYLSDRDVEKIMKAKPSSLFFFGLLVFSTFSDGIFTTCLCYLIESDDIERASTFFRLKDHLPLHAYTYRCAAAKRAVQLLRLFRGKETKPVHFWTGTIPTIPDSQSEMFALECLQLLETETRQRKLLKGLRCVAGGCRSVPLARFFIQKGADPKKYRDDIKEKPLLFIATAKDWLESVELARYLIQCGADTKTTYRGRRLEDTPAGRNIQKWTGQTWDEFVADALSSTG